MSHEIDSGEIEVSVSIDGIKLDEQQQRVVEMYEQNIQTFIKKNQNYGGSFENSAKLESIMRHGEIREDELFDIIAQQILVRGFYDKLSRFHQLQIQDNDDLVGEDVEDTLLDMANYAVMLAAMRRKYAEQSLSMCDTSTVGWDPETVEECMEEFEYNE